MVDDTGSLTVDVPEDRARYPLFDPEYHVFTVWTVPASGVAVEIELADLREVDVELLDRSYTLPDAAASLVDARGLRAVPSGLGDATLVRRTMRIAAP